LIRIASAFTVGLLGIVLSMPAVAAPPYEAPPRELFADIVQDEDVALIKRYLREALGAAMVGREPPAAGPLIERADAIRRELQKRGLIAGHAVLDAIERALRDESGEPPKLPPSSPYRRI
jgi:hypothetical protein